MSDMRRLEDTRLITGGGTYVADLVDADTLHCAFVRSPVAHGTVSDLDLEPARSAAGVTAVFAAVDLDLRPIPGSTGRGPTAEPMVRPPLATDRVRYVGEPIAVVVAESERAALDAAELVFPDIEELPVVNGLDDQFELFDGTPNTIDTGTLEWGGWDAPTEVRVAVDVENGRIAPVPIEPLAALAQSDGDAIHLWVTHQAPHRFANQVAMLLDVDRTQVRVTAPDVGGAFGMKGMVYPEYLVVAACARRLRARVAWIQRRREMFSGGTHGRAQRHRMTIEGDPDGTARRLVIETSAETGAYPHNGSQIPGFTRLTSCGIYDFDQVEMRWTIHVTNRAPTGSYRGAGRPEAAMAIERAMDEFGRAVGLDPFEVRIRNAVPTDALPMTMPTGAIYDSGDYRSALEMCRELIDVDAVRRAQAAAEHTNRRIGLGVGAFVERAGGAPQSGEYAKVEVADDAIVVRTGAADQGQGHRTVWTDLTRRVFGEIPVRVHSGDTAEVADGVGTFASRSAQIGGSAIHRTASVVLDAARSRAAHHLEVAEEDLDYSDGVFSVRGVPGATVTVWELAADEPLAEEEMYSPGAQTFPYGVHAAVVEVDIETGEVTIDRIVAVDDSGTVLNHMIVEGQLAGSLAQGIGQALYESIDYDEWGQLRTSTMMDYPLPRAMDIPPITSARLEHPAPSNPLGVKGAGEAGCIGGPPAIVNAVIDALRPLGVRDLTMPLRPDRVWQAIRDAAGASP